MNFKNCPAYEPVERHYIKELASEGILLRHKKTGARVALLSNDDENKVFYVGFRTPPSDSTGVAHIVEHTVLCGSEHFPVKDPFVELVKGSLNTFLNAMTYPDKTVYPVASCNDRDFKNLMHVYMDAVFHPNIYNEKKIFMQEGWHYELKSKDAPLTINGVVYSEMKGAFSSPDDVHDREVFNSLFPDTAYGVESGGDPEVIPELTYEAFLDFHRRYYHPSNSYIYLYGDMDFEERLNWMDENYLSKYEALHIDSAVPYQKCPDRPAEIRKCYPVAESEPVEKRGYLSYNVVVGDNLDRKLYIAFQVLDYVLCSAPGSPIKRALTDAGIGSDIYSLYENGILQPYFSIVAKNTDSSQKEDFISTVRTTLEKVCTEGIEKKALRAALSIFEFRYREADFGHYPKGLMYGLQMLDSWLYAEDMPFIHIEAGDTFAFLKSMIDTDYYEKLIKEYIIENRHRSVVVIEPERGLQSRRDADLAAKLEAYRASLSKAELEAIISDMKALGEYQDTPDTEEALRTIPLLKREDMRRNVSPLYNREGIVAGRPALFHDIFTGGIAYIKLHFDASRLSNDLFGYLGLFKTMMGYVDTEHYTYGELFNEVNIYTGGINGEPVNYPIEPGHSLYHFEIRCKTFHENVGKALELISEFVFRSDYRNKKRFAEIVSETKSRLRSDLMGAGHMLAAYRALSYFSEGACISEKTSGLDYYYFLEDLDRNFDERWEDAANRLYELTANLFAPDNLTIECTMEAGRDDLLEDGIRDWTAAYEEFVKAHPSEACEPFAGYECSRKNEGLTFSSQVQYVAVAGNFLSKGFEYTGALKVLKQIMGYDYLWNNVRVRGNAYGCMCSFRRLGSVYFVSYRDPKLEETLEVYRQASSYLRSFEADERELTKYVIGAISDEDVPMTPSAKGSRSGSYYFSEITLEEAQKHRDQLLDVTVEDIRRLADYLDAVMSYDCICVVGGTDRINASARLFGEVRPLFD